MHLTALRIETPVERSADLTDVAGLPLELDRGDLEPGPDLLVEEDFVRRLSELSRVAASPIGEDGDRVEYRMLNGVRRAEDEDLKGLPLRYELTAMTGRPIGWEAAKTAGHTHVRPDGAKLGYAEIVEVLHGEAGFLMHDLVAGPDGPKGTRAWLVRAHPGDWVIFPPGLAHVTIDLGAGPLVFSDVIDRGAAGVYEAVAEARGFAWYVGHDGTLRANDRYAETPELEEVEATDWSGPAPGPLYEAFRVDPARFAWLSEPDSFPEAAPRPWTLVRETVERLG